MNRVAIITGGLSALAILAASGALYIKAQNLHRQTARLNVQSPSMTQPAVNAATSSDSGSSAASSSSSSVSSNSSHSVNVTNNNSTSVHSDANGVTADVTISSGNQTITVDNGSNVRLTITNGSQSPLRLTGGGYDTGTLQPGDSASLSLTANGTVTMRGGQASLTINVK